MAPDSYFLLSLSFNLQSIFVHTQLKYRVSRSSGIQKIKHVSRLIIDWIRGLLFDGTECYCNTLICYLVIDSQLGY